MATTGKYICVPDCPPKDAGTLSMSEYRKQNPQGAPHCDAAVLHAPGECEYCDGYPDWQMLRKRWGINFTGHHEPDKATCPAELRRPVETINRWGGNRPKKEGALLQNIVEEHKLDDSGNPAGGYTQGTGISITWQNGPLGRGEDRKAPNGAFVEGVLQAALGRLNHYQATKFKCRENALAITKIEEALHWLQSRTASRESRGVEGTHEA